MKTVPKVVEMRLIPSWWMPTEQVKMLKFIHSKSKFGTIENVLNALVFLHGTIERGCVQSMF